MKSSPILFSGPMVRAILYGTKTQTRRVVRYPKSWLPYADNDKARAFELFHAEASSFWNCADLNGDTGDHWQCGDEELPQNYQRGDRLWVRETHLTKASGTIYRADFDSVEAAGLGGMYGGWKPAIFMPRDLSRITLEIVAVRVERLQAISKDDAQVEGVTTWGLSCNPHGVTGKTSTTEAYRILWQSINGSGSWDANPWVWVIEFKRLQP